MLLARATAAPLAARHHASGTALAPPRPAPAWLGRRALSCASTAPRRDGSGGGRGGGWSSARAPRERIDAREAPQSTASPLAKTIGIMIRDVESLPELEGVLQEWGGSFDAVHAAAAFAKAAKMAGRQPADVRDLLARLAPLWGALEPGWTVQGMANVLWAAGKVGCADDRLWSGTLAACLDTLGQANDQDMANVVYGLSAVAAANRGAVPGVPRPELQAAVAALVERLWILATSPDGVDPQAISTTFLGCARLRLNPGDAQVSGLLQALARPAMLGRAKPQELANVLWAASELQLRCGWRPTVREAAWRQLLGEGGLERVGGGDSPQQVSNAALALARLVTAEPPAISRELATEGVQRQLEGAVAQQLGEWNAFDVSNTLWACAELGLREQGFTQRAADAAPGWLPGAAPPALNQATWACGTLRFEHPQLLAALVARAQQLLAPGGGGRRPTLAEAARVASTVGWAVAVLDQVQLAEGARGLVVASGAQRLGTELHYAAAEHLWVHAWLVRRGLLDGRGLAGALSAAQLAACEAAAARSDPAALLLGGDHARVTLPPDRIMRSFWRPAATVQGPGQRRGTAAALPVTVLQRRRGAPAGAGARPARRLQACVAAAAAAAPVAAPDGPAPLVLGRHLMLSDFFTSGAGPLQTAAWQVVLDVLLPLVAIAGVQVVLGRAVERARAALDARVAGEEGDVGAELRRRSTLAAIAALALGAPARALLPPLLVAHTLHAVLRVLALPARCGWAAAADAALQRGLHVGELAFVTWFLIALKDVVVRDLILVRAMREGRKELERVYVPLNSLVTWAAVLGCCLYAATSLGVALQPLLAVGGAGGIAAGFASQQILTNIVSGVNIFLTRPFVVGDQVQFAGAPGTSAIEGTVASVEILRTLVCNSEGTLVAVPNKLVAELVIFNRTRSLAHTEPGEPGGGGAATAAPQRRVLCFHIELPRELEPQLDDVRADVSAFLEDVTQQQLRDSGLIPSHDEADEGGEGGEGEDDGEQRRSPILKALARAVSGSPQATDSEDEGEGEAGGSDAAADEAALEAAAASAAAEAAAPQPNPVAAAVAATVSSVSSAVASVSGSPAPAQAGGEAGRSRGAKGGKGQASASGDDDAGAGAEEAADPKPNPVAAAVAAAVSSAVAVVSGSPTPGGEGQASSDGDDAGAAPGSPALVVRIALSRLSRDCLVLFVRCEMLLPATLGADAEERQVEAVLMGVSQLVRERYNGTLLW
ncbi:MSL1 [Scenedesmus sp. PABB004]|nr:MSL1 [Scenedesmus sp. PABB004]